jgi:hypothetical protein
MPADDARALPFRARSSSRSSKLALVSESLDISSADVAENEPSLSEFDDADLRFAPAPAPFPRGLSSRSSFCPHIHRQHTWALPSDRTEPGGERT